MEEKRPFWLDTDGGDTIQFFDQVCRVKASGAQTGGLFGLVEVSTSEGSTPGRGSSSSLLERFLTATWSEQRRPDTSGSFPSGWETFYHDVVRATGAAAPAPAVVAELAKERGVTLLGPPPAP